MTRGPARSGFDLDLAHGEYREGALAEILRASGPLIEVKSDGKCRETGFLFIEYQQKGRPSGIKTTEAQWWAFEYYDNFWLIVPTERLKRAARRAWHAGNRRAGGDNNAYEGVLVPLVWLTAPAQIEAA